MKRLVYSPKAFVYVQTDNGFYNLSDLVVSGNVHRKINQVSTAEITFKNPYKMFTKPGNPTFRPMDRITVFLQRIPGAPVQVFTGYLDETPYFQMYPGTCTLRASCTLKRLLYTYFDPGVPFMTTFMTKYGWRLGPDGMLQRPLKGDGKTTIDQAQGSSAAELLFAVMRHIGGWTGTREVFIDELPDNLVLRLTRIYDVLAENEKESMDDFKQFLKNYIGTDSQGGGADVERANISLDHLNSEQNKVLDTLMSVGDTINAKERWMIAAIATGLVETGGPNPGDGGLLNLDHGDDTSVGWRQELDIWGTKEDRMNVSHGARRFYTACSQKDHGQPIGDLCQDVQGSGHPERYANRLAEAKSLYRQYMNKKHDDQKEPEDGPRDSGPANNQETGDTAPHDGGALGWARSKLGHFAEPSGTNTGDELNQLEKTFGGMGEPWCAMFATTAVTHGGVDKEAKTPSVGQIRTWAVEGSHGYKKGLQKHPEPGDLVIFGGSRHVGIVERIDGNTIHTIEGNTGANKVARRTHQIGEGEYARPDYGSGGAGSSNSDGGGDASDSAQSAASEARAAVVQATFNIGQFSTEESNLLQGDKSLMNDQPLLPFVEELCKGSMRNFMSMPDGSFYAFFPDYFGSFSEKPYWRIHDIEVMEGDIKLTDDALATHVYVTGDIYGTGSAEDITMKLQTHGVINILNAGAADFLNIDPEKAKRSNTESKKKGTKGTKEPDLEPFLGDPDAAIQFLKRYGARPRYEPAPFIRSHLFETFYAFQLFMLMWARQFLTTFTFTFMPELYPGGIVEFPDHGIQMYIDEVHHTFDYTSGFTTQANLSAPSAMPWVSGQAGTASISRGMVRGGVLSTEDDPNGPT